MIDLSSRHANMLEFSQIKQILKKINYWQQLEDYRLTYGIGQLLNRHKANMLEFSQIRTTKNKLRNKALLWVKILDNFKV